jgi:hypothetical protein
MYEREGFKQIARLGKSASLMRRIVRADLPRLRREVQRTPHLLRGRALALPLAALSRPRGTACGVMNV